MKKLFFFVFITCITCACNKIDSNKYIAIKTHDSPPIDFSSIAYNVDTIGLSSMNDSYVSMVKDMCFNDSLVYIADYSNSLSVFSLQSGTLIKQIQSIGHGHGEYSDITAISLNSDKIYLLDQSSLSIIIYDENLEYIDKIKITIPALDFEAINTGFLFFNMNVNENLGCIVKTDMEGNIIKNYLGSSPLPEHLSTPHFLTKINNEKVYISDIYSNNLYIWENNNINVAYKLKVDRNDHEIDSHHSFVTDDKIVTSYIYGEKKYYNIYDRKKDTSTSGYFDINSGRPFSPMSQYGNTLAGVFSIEDLKQLKNWNPGKFETCDLVVFLYHF